ncbi:MAG TPA: ABC transporter permease [Myxococcota bacterium]|nr:ABC transporter permease [Myxococcota bacterium]
MGAREILAEALRTLAAHRGRALMTLFGVVWGTAAVVFLTSWGAGVSAMIESNFFRSGRNLTQVWPGRVREEFSPAVDRRFLWFTKDDLAALRRRTHLADRVGGESPGFRSVVFHERSRTLDVRGSEPSVQELRGIEIAQGRGLTPQDEIHRRRVALLGVTARERLLGPSGGIGSRIRIEGEPFEVVGLIAPVGTQLSRDTSAIDEQVWIPLSTYQGLWPEAWTDEPVVRRIAFRVADRHALVAAQREVRAILAERLRVPRDDDEAIGMYSSLEMLNRLGTERFAGVLFVLAVTTLGVGGIGVLTLMLDAVHERRQEIGLRLAVGARPRDVLRQIFLETFAITLGGGLLGVALGVGGCLALARLRAPDLVPLPILQPHIVVVAIVATTTIGVLAAIAPARRAMRVEPSITLRQE